MTPLRWGICSAGKISHDFVVGLKTLPETDHLAFAVAARSLDAAVNFAETHSIPNRYGSYAELAANAEVDVVYVGTIHPHHLQTVMMMFEAGKPVLCEKPLTLNAEDTRTLIQAARQKGVFLMETQSAGWIGRPNDFLVSMTAAAFHRDFPGVFYSKKEILTEGVWMRFFPAMAEVRRQIAEGALGEVKLLHATFGFRNEKVPERIAIPELGGGAILDIGVYVINLATMVFGEIPSRVQSTGTLLDSGVDETAAINLRYSGGRVAQITCSVNLSLPNEAVISGTKGRIRIPAQFWCPIHLETPDANLKFPLPIPYLPTNFVRSEGLCYEAEAVRNCLASNQKESEVMSLDHTQIVADIMDTIMQQIQAENM